MKCNSCQHEINDGSQFCPYCGAPAGQVPPPVNRTPPPPPQPVRQPTYSAPKPPKKGNGGNIAIIVAGVVAVALIVAGTVIWLNRDKDRTPDEPVMTANAAITDTVVKHDTVVVSHPAKTQASSQASDYSEPEPDKYDYASGTPTKVVVTGQGVRLRLEPSLTSGTLTYTDGTNVHPRLGEVLKYIGETDDFYYVSYKGHNVYISKQFSIAK